MPVLIIAQSGRFLAQSATHAGFTVWVADCFGDSDTLAVCDKWLQLPAITTLNSDKLLSSIDELTRGEQCYLAYGSGLEHLLTQIKTLPENVILLGNTASTLSKLKTPRHFFKLLDEIQAAYPKTLFHTTDELITQINWLRKSSRGFGGNHIDYFDNTPLKEDQYLQQKIEGVSGSALFLASNHTVTLLSVNKQLTALNSTSFAFQGIETPLPIKQSLMLELKRIMQAITKNSDLVGLNSIDFIIANSRLLVLEVNPRPSASMELIHSSKPLFLLHLLACEGKLKAGDVRLEQQSMSLRYLFAEKECVIPENMEGPISCHDLPKVGTKIYPKQPICSSLVDAKAEDAEQGHLKNHLKIVQQIC